MQAGVDKHAKCRQVGAGWSKKNAEDNPLRQWGRISIAMGARGGGRETCVNVAAVAEDPQAWTVGDPAPTPRAQSRKVNVDGGDRKVERGLCGWTGADTTAQKGVMRQSIQWSVMHHGEQEDAEGRCCCHKCGTIGPLRRAQWAVLI